MFFHYYYRLKLQYKCIHEMSHGKKKTDGNKDKLLLLNRMESVTYHHMQII